MARTVLEYVREDGANPYRTWFNGLDVQAATKIAAATARLETGNTSRLKRIGAISEYRIDRGPGYRIYLGLDGDALVILLGGGTKKRQQAEIKRATALWTEYRARKAAARAAVRRDKWR